MIEVRQPHFMTGSNLIHGNGVKNKRIAPQYVIVRFRTICATVLNQANEIAALCCGGCCKKYTN